MNRLLVLTFALLLMVRSSWEFSHGAPISRCVTLTPSHQGTAPQTTPAPYEIIPRETSVENGGKLLVEIRPRQEGLTFRGFMLQARTSEGVVVGQFQTIEGVEFNHMDCSGFRTTVTNANNNEKTSIVFEWAAPMEFTGTVTFQ
jgi:hypothetical protein